MPNHHRCRHPRWHGLSRSLALLAWLLVAPRGGGRLIWYLTGDPVVVFVSIGLLFTAGTFLVGSLVAWRCQAPVAVRRGRPAWSLALLGWVIGRQHR
jgi:hypothetical protein